MKYFLNQVAGFIFKKLKFYYENFCFEKLLREGKLKVGCCTYGKPIIFDYPGNYNHKIIIGKFCSISEEVRINIGGEHHTDWVSTYPFRIIFNEKLKYVDGQPFSRGNTEIGNDVWIGKNVLIRGGVKIASGAVVGMGSVIVNDVGPYEIVAGNPARFIKKRFSDEQIAELLKIAWWDWPPEKIKKFIYLLSSENISEFLIKSKTN